MIHSIVHKGERYNILINVLMPGAGGTTATCRQCPELLELGDDPTRSSAVPSDGVTSRAITRSEQTRHPTKSHWCAGLAADQCQAAAQVRFGYGIAGAALPSRPAVSAPSSEPPEPLEV